MGCFAIQYKYRTVDSLVTGFSLVPMESLADAISDVMNMFYNEAIENSFSLVVFPLQAH